MLLQFYPVPSGPCKATRLCSRNPAVIRARYLSLSTKVSADRAYGTLKDALIDIAWCVLAINRFCWTVGSTKREKNASD